MCQLPASQLYTHPMWALTPASVLVASMDQRQGPPERRPAGPATHLQPKVSPGLSGCHGQDYMTPSPPIPSSWSLIPGVRNEPCSGLTLLCCDSLQEGTLWGFFAILSLLVGLATGTLRTPHCNETLDAAPTPRGMATASLSGEDTVEAPLAAAWSQLYGAFWDRPPAWAWRSCVWGTGRLGATVGTPSPCGAVATFWGWVEGISTHGALSFMLGMWQSPRNEKMRRFLAASVFPPAQSLRHQPLP